MIKKNDIKDMLETHLDKIVLGLMGLVSLYLLWTFVVGGPYDAVVNNRKIGPGQIDLRNRKDVQLLAETMNEPSDPILYDQKISSEFEALLQCTLPELAMGLSVPYPGVGTQVGTNENRIYPMPEIVSLTDVQIAWLRGAVHKPTAEIGPETPYNSVSTELGDLDVVTVSGRIDVQTLYRNFQQSFVGPRLIAAWREPAFAKPIFARIELQRRQRLSDGIWGDDWKVVPQTKIDPFVKLFEQTPMTTEQMEFGGVMMWTKQYEDPRVQLDLLQPVAYDFASLQTPWLPPKYMEEAQTILKKQEEELRRAAREERLRSRETGGTEAMPGGVPGGRSPAREPRTPTRSPAREPRTPARTPTPSRGGRDTSPGMPGMMGPATTPGATAAATARRERTLDDIQKDMEKDRITEKTKLESRKDPLLVWVHDDTLQPGATYQYRIRIGVFNPIAGSDWFREDQKQYKNQVILWSSYFQVVKEVSVPKMMHIFPTETLTKEAAGGVKVEVAKYYLGQWRTHEFEVFPGQFIGHTVEETPKATAENAAIAGPEMAMADIGMGGTSSSAQKVDYSTPYMLVDINSIVEWGATFNRAEYWKILYCGPESVLQAMAIGNNNWPAEMRRDYKEIKEAEQNALPLNMSRTTMMPAGGTPSREPMMPMMPDMPMMPMGPGGF